LENLLTRAALPGKNVRSIKIREMISILESKGWHLVRTRGSHRQYHHPDKPGTVTVAGKPSQDLSQDMIRSILKQAELAAKDLP
jgi:predicted RNA binding protein YcfA (HicA-like mRNA interferase family)